MTELCDYSYMSKFENIFLDVVKALPHAARYARSTVGNMKRQTTHTNHTTQPR